MSAELRTIGLRLDVSFRTDLTVEQIAPLWLSLEGDAHPSFFLSWQWIGCWLRQTGLIPNLLLAHHAGILVGIAILQSATGANFPYARSRHLSASGNAEFDSVFVEYNGFLATTAWSDAVGIAFRDYLAGGAVGGVGWSRLLLPGSGGNMLALWADDRFVVRVEPSREAPFIEFSEIRGRHTTYLESRSRNCRQQIRRSMRLFEAGGPIDLDIPSSLDEARVIFDDLKLLHQRSWRARGKPGAFASPFFERFHRALIDEAWPSGQIDLIRVRVGSQIIGCLYNFVYNNVVYAYQSGFAYDDDPRHKPGLVAHAMTAERYMNAGHDRYMLLAGESRYKTSLATGADTLYWMSVRRAGVRAVAEDLIERLGRRIYGVFAGKGPDADVHVSDDTNPLRIA